MELSIHVKSALEYSMISFLTHRSGWSMSGGGIKRDKVVVRATELFLVIYYDIAQPVWRICGQYIKNVAAHMCWSIY